jgi:hypothetical protein
MTPLQSAPMAKESGSGFTKPYSWGGMSREDTIAGMGIPHNPNVNTYASVKAAVSLCSFFFA